MIKEQIKLKGVTPLLMSSERCANPIDPLSKQIKELTGKRKKTDEDLEQIARLEWEGQLYMNEEGPVIPGENVEAMIRDGAKFVRMGRNIQRGLQVVEQKIKLEYSGPRDIEGLWNQRDKFSDMRSVVLQKKRIMRCRPIFHEWAISFTVLASDELLNMNDVMGYIKTAGDCVGICDYRPRYGRFEIVN